MCFKGLKKIIFSILKQESTNYNLQNKSGPLPIFVSKVLLGHSHDHSLFIVYGYFCATRAEPTSCHTPHLTFKAEIVQYLAFYNRSLSTPTLKLQFKTLKLKLNLILFISYFILLTSLTNYNGYSFPSFILKNFKPTKD